MTTAPAAHRHTLRCRLRCPHTPPVEPAGRLDVPDDGDITTYLAELAPARIPRKENDR